MAGLVVIPSRNKQLADTIERRIRLSRYGTKPAELLAQGFLDSWRLYRLYPTRTK